MTAIGKIKPFFEKFFLFLGLLLLLSTPSHAQVVFKVVVYGDSLTSGYQLSESEAYSSKLYYKLKDIGYTNVQVVNMSVAGQTTSSALEGITELLSKRPDIVIVQLGSNDALRGVNTDLIYKNLIDIIGKLQQNKIYVIVMGVKAPETMDPTYVRQLEAVYNRLVNFYRTPFYPNILQGVLGNPDLNQADGYHPNSKGVDYILENTYLLVDTGLRYRWDKLYEQSGYQPESNEALPPAMPPSVEPKELPPSVH